MKNSIFFIIFPIITVLTFWGFTGQSFCWSLFEIIKCQKYGKGTLEKTVNFQHEIDFVFLPPLKNKSLFESVDDLSICKRRDVRWYIYLYLTEGRRYLRNAFKRSKLYLHIIDEIFEKNKDIPQDISLLPLLESAFNPYAVSKSNAVGMWQFLLQTSRSLGLKTDRWVDERRDIEKSTIAAIRHLRGLYNTFNSWELALAAYNGGATHVKRAMIKTGAKNLSQLQKFGALKKETSEYVPRFIALLVIYKNQLLFDIDEEIGAIPSLETDNVVLHCPVSIHQISKISGVPIKTLRIYNPELKRNTTPPYCNRYTLRLPIEGKDRLEKNKLRLYQVCFRMLKCHIVKKGECLSRIAERYKTQTRKIIVINDIKNPHMIRPGLKLYIPI